MSMHDLIPAHFLSSSLPDDSLLTAAFKAPSTAAGKGSPEKKTSTPSPTTTRKPDLPYELPPLGLGHSALLPPRRSSPPPAPSSTRARALSSGSNAQNGSGAASGSASGSTLSGSGSGAAPLPAPIGIPAARRRSPSAAASMRPPLSSSPTHTPFSVTPVGGVPPPARLGASAAPISPILIPRTPSPPSFLMGNESGARGRAGTGGTPGLSASASPTSGSVSPGSLPASPPSPSKVRAGSSSPTATRRDVSPSSPKKSGRWGRRFFDFDHMLGALDPNRIAQTTCPDPVKAVVFGAETETGLAVCRAMVHARHYIITALTVDDQCDAARELKEHGIRVVAVDMDSPASYAKELVGAKAVYLSSNVMALHAILHHQHEPKRTEIARAADRCQLSKAVRACSRAQVGHVIFRVNACGHEVIENVLGKPKVVTETPEDLDRLGIMHTVLHTSVPFNRITEWLEETPKGLVLNVPVPDDTALPLFPIEQTGDYVLAALRNPKKWAGKEMHAIASVMTPTQIAARLSKLSRRPVDTMHPTREEFMSFESHERLALRWDAWAQLVRHEYVPDQVSKASKHDVPDEMDFDAWIAQDRAIHQRLKF